MNKDNNQTDFIIDDSNNEESTVPKIRNGLFGKKKTKYVPDAEIMQYIKEKKAKQTINQNDFTQATTIEDAPLNDTIVACEPVNEIVEETATNNMSENIEATAKKINKTSFDFKGFVKKLREFFIPKKGDTVKQTVIKCVSILCVLVVLCSTVYLSVYFIDLSQQDAEIDNIRNMYELNRYDYTVNADGQFSKFDALKTQNSDIVGWLNIANTKIDNPVYQTIDNDYYITHDMNKEYNSYGALFLDYRCKFNPLAPTQNLIVYGHNMRYGAMFGTLNDYRKIDFYKSSPTISFDTLYEQKKYKIFAMMIVNTTEDNTFGYSFSAYRPSFNTQEEFLKWIGYCKDRSIIDTTVDVEACDEIITLSTCCYDFDEARFVVMGRLVREGEDESVDTTNAKVNEDVIYTKEWYTKKRLPIPKLEENK